MVIVTPPGLSTVQQKVVLPLRTVPTKYNGFCPRLGPSGKSRSLKGPQRKLRVAKHVFEITSLEPQRNADVSTFLIKSKGYFFTDFLRIQPYTTVQPYT